MRKYTHIHTAYKINTKLLILAILNITDYIFTKILLTTGIYYEVNIIMRSIIDNLTLSILIKLFIPTLLLYVMSKRLLKATVEQLHIANILLTAIVSMYSLINLFHIANVVFLKITNLL